jgi:hypothetical protein
MKTKKSFLVFFFLLIVTVGFAQGKTNKQLRNERRIEKQKETEALINAKEFTFIAKNSSSQGFGYVDLISNPNFMEFRPDFIKSEMPFFGTAYSGVGYGDRGLHFEGKPQEFTVEKRKKRYEIKTVVKGDTDVFTLFLSVFFEGSTTLTISSNNRSTITYNGGIFKTEKKAE